MCGQEETSNLAHRIDVRHLYTTVLIGHAAKLYLNTMEIVNPRGQIPSLGEFDARGKALGVVPSAVKI